MAYPAKKNFSSMERASFQIWNIYTKNTKICNLETFSLLCLELAQFQNLFTTLQVNRRRIKYGCKNFVLVVLEVSS